MAKTRKKVTPRQAGSARTLDRWQLEVDRAQRVSKSKRSLCTSCNKRLTQQVRHTLKSGIVKVYSYAWCGTCLERDAHA